MPLSRERAVDLAQRIADRLAKTPGVAITAEREYLTSLTLRALLDWDKELERLMGEAARKVAARLRGAEGSRQWELASAEELERLLAAELARGE